MGLTKVLLGSTIPLIILGLMACAGPTGYTKADPLWTTKYGYSDKRIEDDEFSIVVTGNPLTSKERVAEIALLRGAHLTKEAGRTHFVILKQKTEILESASAQLIALPIGGLLVWVPVGEKTTKEPTAIIWIHLLPFQTAYPPDALDANAVIEQLDKHFE